MQEASKKQWGAGDETRRLWRGVFKYGVEGIICPSLLELLRADGSEATGWLIDFVWIVIIPCSLWADWCWMEG